MSFYRGQLAQTSAIAPTIAPVPSDTGKNKAALAPDYTDQPPAQPFSRIQLALLLFVGIMAYSSGAIFIRLATVTEGMTAPGFILVLSATRLAIASLFWLPAWRGFATAQYPLKTLCYSIMAGIGLATYLASWMMSLSYTSITISTVLSNTQPIWAIFLAWWWFRDQPHRMALVGTSIALAGSLIISAGPSAVSGHYRIAWLGNSLATVGAIANCLYLMFGHQAHKGDMKMQHHIALTYSTAALILIPIALTSNHGHFFNYSKMTYGYMLLLAIVPQLIGHNCLNWALRSIKPQLLTLFLLAEPIIAGFLGYCIFGEAQGIGVLIGAMILILGVAIVVLNPKCIERKRESFTAKPGLAEVES